MEQLVAGALVLVAGTLALGELLFFRRLFPKFTYYTQQFRQFYPLFGKIFVIRSRAAVFGFPQVCKSPAAAALFQMGKMNGLHSDRPAAFLT